MLEISCAFSQTVLTQDNPAQFDALVTFRPNVAAPQGNSTPTRRPLNLSLVIDRSGSMAGYPLQQAIHAAETLVNQLDTQDILSIVVYDDEIDTILPPQTVTDKAAICNLLRKIRAGGTTNLSGGWLKGCEHVQAQQNAEQIQRVLLLTDGQANVGVTDSQILIKTARQKAELGIVTTTLGFGTGFNEDLLVGMAQASGGNFYYIQSPDDATDVFRLEVESLAAIYAQNLVATLTPLATSGAEIRNILNDYRYKKLADGSFEIMLGDVSHGEDKLLAFEVALANTPDISGDLPLFALAYRYQAVADDVIETFTSEQPFTISVAVGTVEEAINAAPATQVIEQISRIRIARAKAQAIEQADKGQHAAAAGQLRILIEDLRQKGLDERFETAEEIAQLEHFAAQLENGRLDMYSRKEMRDQSYQALLRNRPELSLRGAASGSARDLETTKTADGGIEVSCFRTGGKLRVKVVSDGYNPDFNVQFPRSIREEGIHYIVDELQLSSDGTFYRATGKIRRLVLPGQENLYSQTKSYGVLQPSKISARTVQDLEVTSDVGNGVLVQCLKDKGKLRARVVSDGYNPNYNMRFPRDIRQEGTLYVVDQVNETSNGGVYVACGKIRRFVQPVSQAA